MFRAASPLLPAPCVLSPAAAGGMGEDSTSTALQAMVMDLSIQCSRICRSFRNESVQFGWLLHYGAEVFEVPARISRPSPNLMVLPFTVFEPSRASQPSTMISVPTASDFLSPPRRTSANGAPVSTAQF